jgi:diguanylate cyclase (GGDEF)-like protein
MSENSHPSPLLALFEASGELALHLDSLGCVTHVAGRDRVPGLGDSVEVGRSFFALFSDQSRGPLQTALDTALASKERVPFGLPLRTGLVGPVEAQPQTNLNLHWQLSGYNAGGRRGIMAVAHRASLVPARPTDTVLRDMVTGLPNRQLLEDRCAQAIVSAKRQDSGVALMLVNLKGLRKVNDALGVRAGDELLATVGQRMVSHLRASDTVARMGADEYALLMPDTADPARVLKVGQQLLALLEAPFTLGGTEVHVSASAGLAVFPLNGRTHEDLLLGAAAALKASREAGGGRCILHDQEARTDARVALSIESALHQGVSKGELYLDYQPLVDITGKLYGAEALMRWKQGGTVQVSPAQFIPVAEDCGLIHILGAWALKAAASGIARINQEKHTALTISVNVSPRQFRGSRFLQSVTDALALSGLPPELLQLEITEGTLMTDPEAAAGLLSGLTDLGVKVAIDDFGTGYSSLAYLKRFCLSALKIDQSFVRDLPSPKDLAICRSVFSMCRELGLKSVAEGVETEVQWHILRDAGCDAIQGYFFGRPMALPKFASLVDASLQPPAPSV